MLVQNEQFRDLVVKMFVPRAWFCSDVWEFGEKNDQRFQNYHQDIVSPNFVNIDIADGCTWPLKCFVWIWLAQGWNFGWSINWIFGIEFIKAVLPYTDYHRKEQHLPFLMTSYKWCHKYGVIKMMSYWICHNLCILIYFIKNRFDEMIGIWLEFEKKFHFKSSSSIFRFFGEIK